MEDVKLSRYKDMDEGRKPYILRLFKPEDLDGTLYINRTCLPENYPPYFFLEHHREHPDIFLVAEMDSKVVGYSMTRIEQGFSNFKGVFTKKGHVISIAVLPHARRLSIATNLMNRTFEALRKHGATEVYLEVRVSNDPALNLYRKLEFVFVRRIVGYYADGEDAWLMAKKL